MKTEAIKLVNEFSPTYISLVTQDQLEEDVLVTLAEGLELADLEPVALMFGDEAAEILLQLVEEVGFAIMEAEEEYV